MSHAARIPALSTRAPRTRRPALATLALVIPFVLVLVVAIVLAATGTQSNVASDGPRGADAGPVSPPRAVPPVIRQAPSRGSAAIAPQR